MLQKLAEAYKKLAEFSNESNYFYLVDKIHFLFDLSIVRLPLQLVAIQFAFEAYMCCSMLSCIHAENERISKHLYVIDWLGTIKRTSARQRRHAKSVRQNGQLLQRQVHGDLKIRAGGMFPVDLQTYSQLMRFVYSLLTFFRGR
ncbi:conserved hypothetical protein [Culex quinquefasciatus]|uniref:Uncharacterized protein n=1 Tax=Culex quinquefasciatus TaxID=7176 RepID=B0X2H0_CULQU|nr:conserved hypothetical protein [Culex quinquefasciatus]|eukprot:XP_001863842.1 conserved hypothetical protein [Culex quinquefasciatus]